ncbi:hypothetical protein [Streptomyces griseoflavus]
MDPGPGRPTAPAGRGLAPVDAYAVETSVPRSAHGTLVRAVIAP